MSSESDFEEWLEQYPVFQREAIRQQKARHEVAAVDTRTILRALGTYEESVAHVMELTLTSFANEGSPSARHMLGMARMSNHLRFGWCLECGEDHGDLEQMNMRAALGLEPLPFVENVVDPNKPSEKPFDQDNFPPSFGKTFKAALGPDGTPRGGPFLTELHLGRTENPTITDVVRSWLRRRRER